MVVVENMLAFAVACGAEFELSHVTKFHILKVLYVCVSAILKRKKRF